MKLQSERGTDRETKRHRQANEGGGQRRQSDLLVANSKVRHVTFAGRILRASAGRRVNYRFAGRDRNGAPEPLPFCLVQSWLRRRKGLAGAARTTGVRERGSAWSSARGSAVQWRATDQLANQFLLVALASVHSIAARNVFMARLLYGIPDSVCDPLARLDLAALPNLAPAVSSRLKARLATCPNFWRDLLTSVYAGGSDSDLSPMRHLGMQLTLQRSLGLRGSRSFDRRLCRGG